MRLYTGTWAWYQKWYQAPKTRIVKQEQHGIIRNPARGTVLRAILPKRKVMVTSAE